MVLTKGNCVEVLQELYDKHIEFEERRKKGLINVELRSLSDIIREMNKDVGRKEEGKAD